MRHVRVPLLRVASLAAVLLICGCSSNNEGKLEGTKWTSLAGTVQGKSIPAGTLGLVFGRNHKLTYRTPSGEYRGTYALGAGDYVTFELDRALPNGGKVHYQRIVVKGDRLTLTDPDGTELSFSKVK
jgi:hypothetical protein